MLEFVTGLTPKEAPRKIELSNDNNITTVAIEPMLLELVPTLVPKKLDKVTLANSTIETIEQLPKTLDGFHTAGNREKATGDILFKLQNSLSDNYINVTDFQMTEINYSDVFERAIESKVTAEQEALKAKNKTVQVQEEAKQKVIAAEAEARSMAIRAQALSQNKSLVQYEAVQKWDGKMPQYMLGNSVPFINVNPTK